MQLSKTCLLYHNYKGAATREKCHTILRQVELFERYKTRRVENAFRNTTYTARASTCWLGSLVLLVKVELLGRHKIRRVANKSHTTTYTASDSTCWLSSLVLLVKVEFIGRRKTGSKRVPQYYLHRHWLNVSVTLSSTTGEGGIIGEV